MYCMIHYTLQEERSRLSHKWSHITYEDPLVSGVGGPPPCSRPLDAAAEGGEERSSNCVDIVIEPVAVDQGDTLTTTLPASEVCPATEGSDGETDNSKRQPSHVTPPPVGAGCGKERQRKLVSVSRSLRSSVEAYQRQYQQYQRLTCTQAEGDFDPSVVITRCVYDSINTYYV